MERQYEVKGIDAKTIGINVDGKETVRFLINSDVQAETVYKSLDYHPGDTYKLVDGGSDNLPEKPYEAFRDFLKSMIEGVNDVQPTSDKSADYSEVQLGVYSQERSIDEGLDEDISF